MQCGVKKMIIKRQEVVRVKCYKCKEEGHKYRECLLWRKTEERKVQETAHVAKPPNVQKKERPVRPVKGKVQETEKKLRRVERQEVAHVAELRKVQQKGRIQSLVHVL